MATSAPAVGASYSASRVLLIWAAAALPMGVMGWVVAPALTPSTAGPIGMALARIGALTAGLAWLCVLSLLIVYREEGDLRWATVRRRLRLNAPRDPQSGETRRRLWLWLIPLVLLIVAWELLAAPRIRALWVGVFPFLAEPPSFALSAALGSPELRAQLIGAWGILALFAVNALFNTFLGEEFLFRGVLLPRMRAAFGRWDWLANGVLFGMYHLHQPWGIPTSASAGALLYTLPAARFPSTWFSIVVHSAQSVYFLFLILGLVLGLA